MLWVLVVISHTAINDGGSVVDTRLRFKDQAQCVAALSDIRSSHWLSRNPTAAFCIQMSKTNFGTPRQAFQNEMLQVLRQQPAD